jgi:hypothetical protein
MLEDQGRRFGGGEYGFGVKPVECAQQLNDRRWNGFGIESEHLRLVKLAAELVVGGLLEGKPESHHGVQMLVRKLASAAKGPVESLNARNLVRIFFTNTAFACSVENEERGLDRCAQSPIQAQLAKTRRGKNVRKPMQISLAEYGLRPWA